MGVAELCLSMVLSLRRCTVRSLGSIASFGSLSVAEGHLSAANEWTAFPQLAEHGKGGAKMHSPS